MIAARELRQWRMAKDTRSYNEVFVERTKALREARGMTQPQMAEALGISLERYQKYEQRSPLPHQFMRRFCLITGTSTDHLLDFSRPILRPVPAKRNH